ncbi:MAG: hypothetical protein ACI9MC_001804 [Kiritimatiellia bacterium]
MKPLRRFLGWFVAIGRYLVASPLRLVIVLVAAGLGGLTGLPPAQVAYDYAWRNPQFCDDCHVHDYANEAYFRSVHAGLTTCHDCHRVPIMHYPRNLWGTIMFDGREQLEHVPHVEEVVCSACHVEEHQGELTGPMTEAIRQQVVKIDDSPLHRIHLDAETANPGVGRGGETDDTDDTDDTGGHSTDGAPHATEHGTAQHGGGHAAEPPGAIDCMSCHGGESNRAHRFEASRDNCVACHEGLAHSSGRLEQLQCQECHFFGFVGK